MMTEDEKKDVTENFLGECLHIIQWYPTDQGPGYNQCLICKEINPRNRTFTTWQDYGDCIEKLVENGEWRDFYIRARDMFCNDFMVVCLRDDMEAEYNTWLHSRTESGEFRLCQLVSEFIREGEVNEPK
jgi:hypothetical protein